MLVVARQPEGRADDAAAPAREAMGGALSHEDLEERGQVHEELVVQRVPRHERVAPREARVVVAAVVAVARAVAVVADVVAQVELVEQPEPRADDGVVQTLGGAGVVALRGADDVGPERRGLAADAAVVAADARPA